MCEHTNMVKRAKGDFYTEVKNGTKTKETKDKKVLQCSGMRGINYKFQILVRYFWLHGSTKPVLKCGIASSFCSSLLTRAVCS